MKYKFLIVLCLVGLVSGAEWMTPESNGFDVLYYTNLFSVDTDLNTGDFYHYVYHCWNPLLVDEVYFKERSSDTITHPVAIKNSDYVVTQSPQDLHYGTVTIGKKRSEIVEVVDESSLVSLG